MEWQRIRSKVREEYFNNLVRLINETDNTDTDETIRIFRQFQHKIYMQKCTFLLIITLITKMENNPVM